MSATPAGWYQDNLDESRLRWWDGQQWTDHTQPKPAQQPPPPPAQQGTPTAPAVTPAPAAPLQQAPSKVPLFGARSMAKEKASELEYLRGEMARLGVLDAADLARERERLQGEVAEQERQLAELRTRVAATQEAEILQEIGIYEYRHPLQDSIAYKSELKRLQDQYKVMARANGGAIETAQHWQVNGSAAEGKKMVRDFSKLMLRAYNAEADNLVRGLKPYKLDSAIDRLTKTAFTIERLGKTMSIRVNTDYHNLRVKELELTADFLEMKAEEKEREREEKARLREERKAQQEMQREKERLEKEQKHYENALAKLIENGDTEAAERMRVQLADISRAIEDVDYRAANIKAGYVYVISNVGALGEKMIKVGLTRRLEPMDRVKELSDASVPFNFDVHALFFSDNAVEIEAKMHERLAAKRVNRVNHRREFFYATPAEAKNLLKELAGDLLEFNEEPEALEYHQSLHAARQESESVPR